MSKYIGNIFRTVQLFGKKRIMRKSKLSEELKQAEVIATQTTSTGGEAKPSGLCTFSFIEEINGYFQKKTLGFE